MGNEFGTDMGVFNIGDYIWYIVGGIALFFVIVGFIADKSGLAKKTFSKDVKKSDKKVKEPIVKEPVVEEMTEPINEELTDDLALQNNASEFDDNMSFVEMPIDAGTVSDDISSVNNEVLENDDIVGDNEPLYISEEPEVSTDGFVAIDPAVDNSEMILDNLESVELPNDNIVDENNDFDNVWNDDTSINDEDSNEDVTFESNDSNLDNIEISPFTEDTVQINEDISADINENSEAINEDTLTADIAADNAEEEWGIETTSQVTEEDNLMDVELPNLDDIEINPEEDVWKF